MTNNQPPTGYEEKFQDFIQMCNQSPEEIIVVHHPGVLGDTYDELVESLNRLADAGKKLEIVPRKKRK
jgi:hypothetical protein